MRPLLGKPRRISFLSELLRSVLPLTTVTGEGDRQQKTVDFTEIWAEKEGEEEGKVKREGHCWRNMDMVSVEYRTLLLSLEFGGEIYWENVRKAECECTGRRRSCKNGGSPLSDFLFFLFWVFYWMRAHWAHLGPFTLLYLKRLS